MTALATTREVELADALTRVRGRLARAAEADALERRYVTRPYPSRKALGIGGEDVAAQGDTEDAAQRRSHLEQVGLGEPPEPAHR